jgi:hypothetical protein
VSLDTVNADGIEQGLARWASNPGPEPEAGFDITSFLGSGAKGLPSATLEVGGSISDVLSAFGTAAATAPLSAGGMFSLPTPEEQKQQEDARQRMLKGEAFDVTAGNVLRSKAQEFAPDPATSHKADQVMHGLVRFGSKAVAAVGTLGPAAGALILGAEEGNTVTQDLRVRGVDTETATKVGAVQGALAAGGAVLPIAGRTIPQTLGLVGVGGPGSYMAQEALSREILQAAGYQNEASLHNPFDPLGLTLSTVIPGGFGALHMRGTFRRAEAVKSGALPLEQMKPEELRALKYNDPRLDAYASATAERYGVPPAILLAIKNAGEKSDPTAVSPKGAKGVMQFMPGTAKEMGLADPTDPVASIDAGARYLKKLHDAYGSWDAAVAHYNGGGAQAAIVRGGGRPTYNETAGYLDRVQKYVAERTAQEAAKSPEAVDAARVAVLNDTVAKSLPDTPDAMAQVQRAADIVAESGGRRAEAEMQLHPERARIETELRDIEEQRAQLLPAAGELAERGAIRTAREEFAQLQRQRPDDSEAAVKALAKDIQERDGVSYKTALTAAKKQTADLVIDFEGRVGRLEEAIQSNAKAQQASQQVVELDRRHAALTKELQRVPLTREATRQPSAGMVRYYHGGNPAGVDGPLWFTSDLRDARGWASRSADMRLWYVDVPLDHPARGGEPEFGVLPPSRMEFPAEIANQRRPFDSDEAAPALREADNALPDADQVKLAGDEPTARGEELGRTQREAAEAPAAQQSPAATLDQAIAQKLALEQPDLQVILPGGDAPISVKEALKRIDAERVQDAQWADLVRVAAECALTA